MPPFRDDTAYEADSWHNPMHEARTTTARDLLYATSMASFAWLLILLVFYPDMVSLRASPLVALVVLSAFLALRIMRQRFLLGWFTWLLAISAIAYVGIWSFNAPSAFLLLLLPSLMMVQVLGLRAGLACGAVSFLMMWAAKQSAWMPHLPSLHHLAAGAVLILLVGYVSRHRWLDLARSMHKAYEDERRIVQQSRQTQVLLMQTREDLMLANRELARLSDRQQVLTIAADEARRTKEAFVANVSHELRTPLNMIIGFADMIPESSRVYGFRLPPPLLADISAIRRNSQHLADLVDDVLDLAQVDSGRMTLSRDWVSLQKEIASAAGAVRALYDSKKLYLDLRVSDDLPNIFCDAARIRQVVLNLLSNAGRFTEVGGVKIEAQLHDQEIVISVIDTGPGIPPEDRERIFEPFQQVDGSIRRRHGGSGLGLAISKDLVAMHGGRLWVDSELGAGSVFAFSLPIDPSRPAEYPTSSPTRWFSPYSEYAYRGRTRSSVAPPLEVGPRLVVLDKDNSLGRIVGRYMQDAEVVTTADPDIAQAEVKKVPTDALVVNSLAWSSDRDIPTGFDLPQQTPMVVCSVAGSEQAARELGVVQYLTKPLSRSALLSAVDEVDSVARSILLVDDQPEVLQLFARMLASAEREYTVYRAMNGQRALDLLRERKPDLAIVDLIMPGMDGYDLLRIKRQDPSIQGIPVIVVSSTDQSGHHVVSNRLSVNFQSELSLVDLVQCIKNAPSLLAPSPAPVDPERLADPPA